MSRQLFARVDTAIDLLGKFQSAFLDSSKILSASDNVPQKDALPLVHTSTESLKSQATKLSLLAISSPFTPSAISAVVLTLIESAIPSLVTATLLVTPGQYTKAFHDEINILMQTVLKELSTLIGVIKDVAKSNERTEAERGKRSELSQPEKDVVTTATGRVWDSCDTLSDLVTKGVTGFTIRRVEEWRDLVEDAVREIEDWNPDDDDGLFDDILTDALPKEDESGCGSDPGKEDTAELYELKKSTLRVLKPVAQIFPAILRNRLKNAGDILSSSELGIRMLESLVSGMHCIPGYVDEAAGSLYEDDKEKLERDLQKVKKTAADAVNATILPLDITGRELGAEDKFTIWSKTWLKVMEEVIRPENI